MESLRPNQQRAKNAIILLWITLAMESISFISGYFQYDLLQLAANGGEFSMEEANANDVREQIIAIVGVIVFIISMITLIQWFRRAYYNLHLRVSNLSHSEGWAAGGWFVPIISLYRPYQIMKELYQETKMLLVKKGVVLSHYFNTSVLGWWWAFWVINSIMGQFLFRYSLRAESIDELITTTVVSMVTNVIGIPVALITIKVIRDYAALETMLVEVKNDDGSLLFENDQTQMGTISQVQ